MAIKHHLILLAGGCSQRFGKDKLMVTLAGKTVLSRCLERFSPFPWDQRVLVLRDGIHHPIMATLKSALDGWIVLPGGTYREESAFLGWQALKAQKEDRVFIHDVSRPAIHPEDIESIRDASREWEACILAEPLQGTLKKAKEGRVLETLPRDDLWEAQTPQAFAYYLLEKAFKAFQDHLRNFTDEASMMEKLHIPVHLIPSQHPNPKLTFPQDLPYITFLLTRG